jgi:two-component system, OmpR family, sensor histidine kinase BaeS
MSDHRNRCAKLVSLAVHEFRTPTAVVAGYLRMVLRHFDQNLSDQQRKLLEESEKSCGALAKLLADFADLAQLEEGAIGFRREPVSLWPLLRDMASTVQEGKDRGVTLEVQTPEEAVVVEGDPRRLSEAVGSLMTAVMRERQAETKVLAACRLGIHDGTRSAVIALGDHESAGSLAEAFDISDSHEQQSFDEYRGGLGFRLPAAARIVEAHGGRLASPVAQRGRLAIVMSLPVTIANAESAA